MNERLSFRFAATTIILLMLALPLFSLFHEVGHVTVCDLSGRDYNFSYNWTACSGKFEDPTMYRMAGGFLSAGISLILFASIKNIAVKKFKPIAIVLVIIAVVEFVNMIQESFLNNFYNEYGSAVSGMLMLGLAIFFIFRHSPRKERMVRA